MRRSIDYLRRWAISMHSCLTGPTRERFSQFAVVWRELRKLRLDKRALTVGIFNAPVVVEPRAPRVIRARNENAVVWRRECAPDWPASNRWSGANRRATPLRRRIGDTCAPCEGRRTGGPSG